MPDLAIFIFGYLAGLASSVAIFRNTKRTVDRYHRSLGESHGARCPLMPLGEFPCALAPGHAGRCLVSPDDIITNHYYPAPF